ncbi:hypothetical protein BRAO285_1120004 [Bradyrhizobium sp. ORS 285]|nr:hypothetical protein BRAO285_1120004 [Bradyrhizobium sp. ORS 285]
MSQSNGEAIICPKLTSVRWVYGWISRLPEVPRFKKRHLARVAAAACWAYVGCVSQIEVAKSLITYIWRSRNASMLRRIGGRSFED